MLPDPLGEESMFLADLVNRAVRWFTPAAEDAGPHLTAG
jgi:hypothetical protein